MKTRKTLSLLVIAALCFSCGKDDDAPIPKAPSVTYSNTEIDAAFYQPGTSDAPTMDWHGDMGTFSLTNSINGLSINSSTGVLSWTKDLPSGYFDIEVMATNSAGSTQVNLAIDNPFQGPFWGEYSSGSILELSFNPDGTVNMKIGSSSSPTSVTGNWKKTKNYILVNYTLSTGANKYSLGGKLVSGTYSGTVYNGHDAESGNGNGLTFETTYAVFD